jgi:hypothetical protein
VAGGRGWWPWLVAGGRGWWLVAVAGGRGRGWWLVAGGWWLVAVAGGRGWWPWPVDVAVAGMLQVFRNISEKTEKKSWKRGVFSVKAFLQFEKIQQENSQAGENSHDKRGRLITALCKRQISGKNFASC